MKNNVEDNNLIYIPEDMKGKHLFDGIPCPTIEVHDLIGDKGVEKIHNKMKQMLEWRKTMFGEKTKENYGFTALERFVDVQNEIVLAVGGTIQNEIEQLVDSVGEENAIQFYPSLVVSNVYAKNNYEKLISKNHYLITVYGQHDVNRHPTISIADYYRKYYPL